MKFSRSIRFAAFMLLVSASARAQETYGLLVMAHGGSPEWNQAILDAVKPLQNRYPLEVAFGMADACSIQQGVRDLEAKGVRKVGVVRLFVSGESWYERTEQILGLKDGAPAAKADECAAGHHGVSHHSMALFRIGTQSSFVLSRQGLFEAKEMGAILGERTVALSRNPEKEDVLVLAHGPGDDAENERWIANINARAEEIRRARPFHAVEVMTLREDWPEKRKEAEQRVRDFVSRAASEGRRAIVIPFRLYGFGPYEKVLAGLEYTTDRQGLLPHANVTQWISRQAEELRAGDIRTK
jgi:sirohydrochlorin cobaltochelatase